MRILRLALRNLARNKRRTALAGGSVLFGVLALVLLRGIIDAFVGHLVAASVEGRTGAVQVFAKGHLGSDDPLRYTLPHDARLMARIEAVPGVVAVAPRIDFDGLISNGSEATTFVATAIDVAREGRVCPRRASQVASGSQPLSPGGRGDMLAGQALADSLGVGRHGTVVLQAAGPHAGTNALEVEIAGFLPTQSMLESKHVVTVRLETAQTLLRMPGRVTEYAVAVADVAQAHVIADRLRAALGDEVAVTTWDELDPMARTRARALGSALLFVAVVLFLLVAAGIVNTMLMSVYERVREIGTMMALGVRRAQIARLLVAEAAALGLGSAAIGAGVGALLVRALGRHGIAVHRPGSDAVIVLVPHVHPPFLVAVIVAALVVAALAALYPAWKAARLRPVEALHAI